MIGRGEEQINSDIAFICKLILWVTRSTDKKTEEEWQKKAVDRQEKGVEGSNERVVSVFYLVMGHYVGRKEERSNRETDREGKGVEFRTTELKT